MAAPQTEVIVTVAGTESARFVLAPGDYVIGRNADCPIRVDADLVSRQHAKLILNYDHALIEDLGSANGTQVNGQPIAKDGRTRLWPNQKIQVGTATIELRRLKHEASDMSLAPGAAMVRRVLPEAFLREKKYDIGKIVAQGGMGAILDAKEATTERTVAMKVMLDTNDADGLARFLNEAKITAQLEHPNIVPVHELSVDENGQPYYTMKMVRGITLKKVLELMAAGTAGTMKKYPLPALLTIFQKVCDALAFAHSKGVIHRDLKPENLMLGDYGEVLVMDWGLAKIFTQPAGGGARAAQGGVGRSAVKLTLPGGAAPTSAESTMDGTIMGTPQFMSPEQARGEVETLDARSDIYSLGAILYQILSLRVPVSGTDAMEVVGKVGRGEIEPLVPAVARRIARGKREASGSAGVPPAGSGVPPEPPDVPATPHSQRTPPDDRRVPRDAKPGRRDARATRDIPDSLAAVVRKAMSLDRAARYATVADLQRDIEAYQTGFATGAEKAGAWKLFTLFVKRHKAVAISTAAALAVLAAVSAAFTVRVVGERNRATRALAELRRTAPTFHEQALALTKDGQLDAALGKIGIAIDLVPSADYLAVRGRILQSLFRFREAGDAFSAALDADSGHAFARENVELSRALGGQLAPDGTLPKAGKETLLAALEKQGRRDEALLLASTLGRTANVLRDEIVQRLQHALQWDDSRKAELGKRIGTDDTGGLSVDLSKLPISDLSVLQGMPVATLSLSETQVTTLQPLTGMPLKKLSVWKTKITTLEPLRGMKLRELAIDWCEIKDLSPLQGMPLEVLSFGYTQVHDLGPLRGAPLHRLAFSRFISDLEPLTGMPLTYLAASMSGVSDLTPLTGMPLRELFLNFSSRVKNLAPLRGLPLTELDLSSTGVSDISPLEGMSIRRLELSGCALLTDLSSLSRIPQLSHVDLPLHVTDLDFLRQHPTLKSFRWTPINMLASLPSVPAPRFWKHYDDLKSAEKKFAAAFAEQGATFTPGRHLVSTRGEFFEADLSGTPLRDLRFLEGLPVAVLKIANTQISDLTPVAKCPLAELRAANSALETIAPLAGARLSFLDMQKTKLTDLTPLRDMPIGTVFLKGSSVKDVSPLAACQNLAVIVLPAGAEGIETLRALPRLDAIGYQVGGTNQDSADKKAADFWRDYDTKKMQAAKLAPLEEELARAGIRSQKIEPLPDGSMKLSLSAATIREIPRLDWKNVSILGLAGTQVSDLTPLRGVKLQVLNITGTRVTDLEPLRGSPLQRISFSKTAVTDIAPLLDCPKLEQVVLPAGIQNLELLRKHPALRHISYTDGPPPDYVPAQTAEEFWKEYDAKKAGK